MTPFVSNGSDENIFVKYATVWCQNRAGGRDPEGNLVRMEVEPGQRKGLTRLFENRQQMMHCTNADAIEFHFKVTGNISTLCCGRIQSLSAALLSSHLAGVETNISFLC